jgi:DNA-binding NarL/FixJ family response regulator
VTTRLRVFIADDHLIFRQGLIKLLESEKSIEIVGESGDGQAAFQMIQELQPGIALLDLCMPGMSGLEIARAIREMQLPVDFIILTMHTDEEYFNAALDCGVKGYLLKDNAISDLLQAVSQVGEGKHYVSPLISEYLVHRVQTIQQLNTQQPGLTRLSRREKLILKLIAENKTNNEIAVQLFISPRTVENHRYHIAEKLDLKGPHKLLQFALENKAWF